MDRGRLNLKSKIAQFEAPTGEVNCTPTRANPAQKSPSNPSWQAADKIKTANKADFQSLPRNLVDQSCDRKFENVWNNEQRPKPPIKPLELQKAPQKSVDIIGHDKGEGCVSHREEILLSPTAKNQKHMDNLSKIISAQGASSRSESSKPLKSSTYSTVIPQVKQKFPNSGSRFHSPVNESSFSGFPPSNPNNILRPDPFLHKAQCSSVPKPPKTDIFGNASAGDRTLKKVTGFSLGNNQPQSNEVLVNTTEDSSPGSHSSTSKIPGLQTSRSSQKSIQQTSPKIKTADDNPLSKGRYQQQTLRTVADVTRNVRRRATDHVTDVLGRRYRRLPLADDIPARPSKKPPQLPAAVDLEMFRSLKRNATQETPRMPTRVVSLIPEWSVEEEEGENDQEDYEVCVDNSPTKDGYVNERRLKNTDSFVRRKTNIGDDDLSDEEIYESI